MSDNEAKVNPDLERLKAQQDFKKGLSDPNAFDGCSQSNVISGLDDSEMKKD